MISYTEYETTGAHVVAQYLWSLMQSELGYSVSDYGGLVPIVAPGRQQELASYSKPYVLMGWSGQPNYMWQMETDIVSFTIYSQTTSEVNKFINLGKRAFKRLDEAADDVNEYISSLGPQYADLKAYDIKSITLRSTGGPEPPMQEGGRFNGTVIVAVDYVYLAD